LHVLPSPHVTSVVCAIAERRVFLLQSAPKQPTVHFVLAVQDTPLMHEPVVPAAPQVIEQSPFVVLHVGFVFAHAALPEQSIPQWFVAVQLTRSLHALAPVQVTSHDVPAHVTPLF
jgi:hypothetical protein